MGYRPQTGSPRKLGSRREQARPKSHRQKHGSSGSYLLDEKPVQTCEEVRDRTVQGLQTLGNQRFALPPFHENFELWLRNLRDVVSEFESNPAIKADDRFREECSKAISDIELDLGNRRRRESSAEEVIRNLVDTK